MVNLDDLSPVEASSHLPNRAGIMNRVDAAFEKRVQTLHPKEEVGRPAGDERLRYQI